AGVVVVDATGALVGVVVLTGVLEVVVEVAPGVVVVVGAGVVLEVVVGPPAIVVEVVDDAGVVVVDATGALVDVVVLTGVLVVVVVRGAAVVVVVVAAGQPALKIRDLHEAWSFPCFTSSLVTWAAQLTYAPWLRAGQHWACAAASASGTPRPLHLAAKPRSEAPRRTARARKPASPIRVPMKSPIRGVGGASFVSPGSGEPYAADAATRECAAMQPPRGRPPPGLYSRAHPAAAPRGRSRWRRHLLHSPISQ